MPRSDSGHHGQPAHGIEPRADDTAMNALVGLMPYQLMPHGDMPVHQRGCDLVNLEPYRLVEGNALFKNIAQARQKLRFELHSLGRSLSIFARQRGLGCHVRACR